MTETETTTFIQQDTIDISISTRGVYTWKVKIIGTDLKRLKAITDEIQKIYPQDSWKNLKVGKEED